MDILTLQREVSDIANLLREADWKCTDFEALQIAVKIQNNKILCDAYVVGNENTPSAFEKSAMELNNIADSITISLSRINGT